MDSPLKGFIFQMINIITFCITNLLSKLVFDRYPEVNAFQILLLRSSISLFIYLILINRNFKKIMIDSVTPDIRFQLIYRTIQANLTLLFLNHAVKYLPLVEVALIVNLMPIFTAIFGYYWLNERLTIFEIVVLAISFAGVTVLILGSNETDDSLDQKISN